jgi:hypothetical protein
MIKQYLLQIVSSFKTDKKKFLLSFSVYASEFIVFFSIFTFSGMDKWHYLPIAFCGLSCLLIFVWLYFYGTLFIDSRFIFIICFPIYCTFLAFFTGFRAILLTYFLLGIMAIFFYEFLANSKHLDLFVFVWLFALLSFAFVFVIVYRTEIFSLNFKRLGDYFDNVNGVSTYFSMGMLLSLYYFLLKPKKTWAFSLMYLFFAFLGITGGSKQFLISGVIITVTGIFFFFKKEKWYLSVASVLVLTIFVFVLLQLPAFSTIKTRLLDFFNFVGVANTGNYDYSTAERFAMLTEAFFMFFTKPFFGYGLDGFLRFSYFGTYSHNTLGDLLADFGLLGAIIFCLPFFFSIKTAFSQNWDKPRRKTLLSLLCVLFLCLGISGVLISEKIYYLGLPLMLSLSRKDVDPSSFSILSLKRESRFKLTKIKAIPSGRRELKHKRDSFKIDV